ncbi:MAG: hypothetical protein LVS60_01715 [Nodosilinea sp. LVE1205-7]
MAKGQAHEVAAGCGEFVGEVGHHQPLVVFAVRFAGQLGQEAFGVGFGADSAVGFVV